MKKCPQCQSVVDDEYECTVCGATITYEPYIDASPRIARGMWLRFWGKRLAVPFAAAIVVIICTLIRQWIDKFTLTAVLGLIISFVCAVFDERITYWKLQKYSEEYAKSDTKYTVYFGAVIAIVTALLSLVLK